MRAQLQRLLDAAPDRRNRVRVPPFDLGEHDVMDGSLTILTLPDGSEAACTEGARYGQLIEDPDEVRAFALPYDRLRAPSADSVPNASKPAASGSFRRHVGGLSDHGGRRSQVLMSTLGMPPSRHVRGWCFRGTPGRVAPME